MNLVVEKQPKCIATLRVEIPADQVQDQRQQILRKFLGKARIPGFRPGKAPRAVIEKRFEKEITEELHQQLISEAYDQALKQEELKVLDFGQPEDLSTLPDGRITFVSTLTLAPEVQVPDYKGVTVTVPPLAVPEEELQAQLNSTRERLADYQDIKDRPAAMNDFAVIDYVSTVDGQPTETFLGHPAGFLADRQGFWIRLDEQTFLPGFSAQLVGMNPGESREITLTLPADFPVPALQNHSMTFSTTLKELKEAILPELNDELAARLVPGKSLADLTEIIRDNMQQERKRKIDDMKVNQIVNHFNTLVDFELPEQLVTQETQSQADAMVRRGVQSGMSEEEIQTQQREIFTNAGQQAVTNLRTNFMLQEIARIENIVVTDAELVNHLARIAQSRKEAPKKFIKDMQRAGRLPSIRNSIAVGKTIDFLVEHAEIIEAAEAVLTED
jgi:trigger factor